MGAGVCVCTVGVRGGTRVRPGDADDVPCMCMTVVAVVVVMVQCSARPTVSVGEDLEGGADGWAVCGGRWSV